MNLIEAINESHYLMGFAALIHFSGGVKEKFYLVGLLYDIEPLLIEKAKKDPDKYYRPLSEEIGTKMSEYVFFHHYEKFQKLLDDEAR